MPPAIEYRLLETVRQAEKIIAGQVPPDGQCRKLDTEMMQRRIPA